MRLTPGLVLIVARLLVMSLSGFSLFFTAHASFAMSIERVWIAGATAVFGLVAVVGILQRRTAGVTLAVIIFTLDLLLTITFVTGPTYSVPVNQALGVAIGAGLVDAVALAYLVLGRRNYNVRYF